MGVYIHWFRAAIFFWFLKFDQDFNTFRLTTYDTTEIWFSSSKQNLSNSIPFSMSVSRLFSRLWWSELNLMLIWKKNWLNKRTDGRILCKKTKKLARMSTKHELTRALSCKCNNRRQAGINLAGFKLLLHFNNAD